MMKERARKDIQAIVKALQMEKLTLVQAQLQFNEVNKLLKQKSLTEQEPKKISFTDNIFLISSIILGSLITISSFIWGII